jgi:hypothetical protein
MGNAEGAGIDVGGPGMIGDDVGARREVVARRLDMPVIVGPREPCKVRAVGCPDKVLTGEGRF